MVAVMDAAVGSNPAVGPAETAAEREAAAEALALAFADDPCWAHLLPDPATRAERLLAYFSTEIESLSPDLRQVWVTADGAGAAVWAPPGLWRVPLGTTMREAARMVGVFRARLPLGLWTLLRIESHHPKRPRHWYLHYLGVEPRRQGKGLGAALLAAVLERCDQEGTPAYLESSTDRNQALYERHGFSLTARFAMPLGGPPIREMWRDPAATG
jgi:GNAT superfamily N-acetyltransferase